MPRKPRRKSKSGIYHVIMRGANRQEIFHDDTDHIRFLETVKKYKMKSDVKMYAWCLMNNHVHLLLKEGDENLSLTMKRIGVSYVNYYHWKYRTTGHLFQGRFKSENVETMTSLLTVVRYIHQNPLKARMVHQVEEWNWSSCKGYYGKDSYYEDLLDSEFILHMFSSDRKTARQRFREFNEQENKDVCLEDYPKKRRLTDDEAREKIINMIGNMEIAHVKSLPKSERDALFRKVKKIDGLTQRQAARILGVSLTLLHRA